MRALRLGFGSLAFCVVLHAAVQLRTVSTRPEMVSGGDVLVEVRSSGGPSIDGAALKLNGQPVPGALRNPAQLVLVCGLAPGNNILEVTAGNKTLAKLALKNHPIEGPVISGPHAPFTCHTETFGLGAARDANCGAESKAQYFYWSTESRFNPLESETSPPADLARTSVNGAPMDFIVRKETGVVNRTVSRSRSCISPERRCPIRGPRRPVGTVGSCTRSEAVARPVSGRGQRPQE